MAYSKRDEKYIVEKYEANPSMDTVNQLCIDLNRTPKSVIAKLSNMGIYEKAGYRTKFGTVPEKKSEIVSDIEKVYDCELPGLDKTPKQTLITLREVVQDQDNTLEEALGALTDLVETSEIKSQMLRTRMRVIQ
jgi:hypothetical protein